MLTTVHSGTTAGVYTRLVNLGVEPYMVSSSITGILAQRLARKICPHCRVQYSPSDNLLKQLPDAGIFRGFAFEKGKGCDSCCMTGYAGRTGIFELLSVDDEIRELMLSKQSAGRIREAASRKGMQTLLDDGIRKVLGKVTTLEELFRVI